MTVAAGGEGAVEPIVTTCPRPITRPVMLQSWNELTSLHWRYDPEVVQRLLPEGLTVDTCDGSAWVGLIPFHMRRIRVPGLAPLGGWSTFPETNVRTYVVGPRGRRGVWFFSLDISRFVPAAVARITYGLPYFWSAMSITHETPGLVGYTTRRRWPRGSAQSRTVVEIGEAVDDADLSEVERFVTARWALASTFAGRLLWAEVEHAPWPLFRARLIRCDDSLVAAAGLHAPAGAPVALWSPGVDVRVRRPSMVTRSAPAGSPGSDSNPHRA